MIHFLFLSFFSIAAPYPMTGSSAYLNNKLNLFLKPYKINLDLKKTPFEIDLTQNESEKWTVKSQENKSIQISLRLRELGAKEDYDKSLKSWIREYEKSGFQVLAQQIPRRNAEQGWIHLQDTNEKQLLQYFKYNDRTWAYFNCVGSKKDLLQLKQSCDYLNSILLFNNL